MVAVGTTWEGGMNCPGGLLDVDNGLRFERAPKSKGMKSGGGIVKKDSRAKRTGAVGSCCWTGVVPLSSSIWVDKSSDTALISLMYGEVWGFSSEY